MLYELFYENSLIHWETDFYTPPVLGGAGLLPFSAPAVYKIRVLRAQDFHTPLALKTAKGQHLPALEVYKNQSPIHSPNLWAVFSKSAKCPVLSCLQNPREFHRWASVGVQGQWCAMSLRWIIVWCFYEFKKYFLGCNSTLVIKILAYDFWFVLGSSFSDVYSDTYIC